MNRRHVLATRDARVNDLAFRRGHRPAWLVNRLPPEDWLSRGLSCRYSGRGDCRSRRLHREGHWQLAGDPHTGATTLSTTTAAAPLAAESSTYPGVRAATARLAGAHQHPELHIRITVDDRASPSDLRHRIDEVTVPRLVGALDLPALDADLLLRPAGR